MCVIYVFILLMLSWFILYFIDILKIDNLEQFKNVVKLQLDNNIIERIEGLSTLIHLEWLGKQKLFYITVYMENMS